LGSIAISSWEIKTKAARRLRISGSIGMARTTGMINGRIAATGRKVNVLEREAVSNRRRLSHTLGMRLWRWRRATRSSMIRHFLSRAERMMAERIRMMYVPSRTVDRAVARSFSIAGGCSASTIVLLQERQEVPELRLLHGSVHLHVGAPPARQGVYRRSLDGLKVCFDRVWRLGGSAWEVDRVCVKVVAVVFTLRKVEMACIANNA
jgi:hypothetical protein